MSRPKIALAALFTVLAGVAIVVPSGKSAHSVDFSVADEAIGGGSALLVDLADHLSTSERSAFLATLPGSPQLNSVFSATEGLYRLEISDAEAASLVRHLTGHPAVEFVELDATYTTQGAVPDDPLYPFQWNFEQIHVEDAWKQASGAGVVVAVIDTGVAYSTTDNQRFRRVRDLEGDRFVPGYDFVDDDDHPYDEHGHGTHVAGTIAQATNNAYGVAGVAPSAKIMPIRVLDASGRGNTADIAESIRWAADNGADVINLSLGGPIPSRILQDAITYAHAKGVTVVAAAGNNGWSMPSYPAAYNHVISVAATQYDRTTTFYSNYGRAIDIAAPGGNTRVDQNDDGRPDGILQETIQARNPLAHEFALYMGTSMASPHVAGVAALLIELGVSSPDRVEAILKSTASRDVPEYSDERYGAGLIDADKAVRAVTTRVRMPRAALSLALLGVGLAFADASRRRRALSVPLTAVVALMAAVGLAPLIATLNLVGVHVPAWLGAGPIELAADALGSQAPLNGVALSAIPALAVVALVGSVRSRWGASIVVGFVMGLAAVLLAEAIAPLRDIQLVPAAGVLDQLWLATNGLVAAAIGAVAIRKP